tara:strand:+ start:19174 stop:20466 length:1293 start_codon:yes stop_codon:yes gene_type:complete
MTNLPDILPSQSETVQAIKAYWKTRGDSEPARGYLGASSIGIECSRELWYSFRKCSEPSFDGRMYRLFNRGHKEEARFVEELRGIGCEVHEFDENGNQFKVIACDGHFLGHTDGAVLGLLEAPKTWHLLEMKTSSSKIFARIKSKGIEKEKPQHLAQMQVYMHLTGLKRALYLVVNKDTDELYSERVRYDSVRAKGYIDKAQSIIDASSPPARISEKVDSFACKFCDARELCHGVSEVAVKVPAIHCRNCSHSTPISDGKWRCDHHSKEIDGTPCEDHIFLPGLINFAEPTDSFSNKDGSTAIEFTSEDGTVWHHGSDTDGGQFNSYALMNTSRNLVTLPNPKKPGAKGSNLEARYSSSLDNVKSVWKGYARDVQEEFQRRYKVPIGNPNQTQEGDGWTAAEFYPHCCVIMFGNAAEIREDTTHKNNENE